MILLEKCVHNHQQNWDLIYANNESFIPAEYDIYPRNYTAPSPTYEYILSLTEKDAEFGRDNFE